MQEIVTISPVDCPGQAVFQLLTSKWTFALLMALREGPKRFHGLRDAVDGISEKVLVETLRNLERDGLVDRSVRHTVPPQVTYALTDLGQGAALHLLGLSQWIAQGLDLITASRVGFDKGQRRSPWEQTRASPAAAAGSQPA